MGGEAGGTGIDQWCVGGCGVVDDAYDRAGVGID